MQKNTHLLLIDSSQVEALMNLDDALEATRDAFLLHALALNACVLAHGGLIHSGLSLL